MDVVPDSEWARSLFLMIDQAADRGARAVQELAESGVAIDMRDTRGYTSLMRSVDEGRQERSEALAGLADPRPESWKGWRALALAAREDFAEVAKKIMADPRTVQSDIDDAMRIAAGHGSMACLRELLPRSDPLSESEENVWQEESKGWTALAMAAFSGKLDAVKMLAPFGGCEKPSPYGPVPKELARSAGHAEVAGWLDGFELARGQARQLAAAASAGKGSSGAKKL